jgi:ABC-type multidrug transport system permease subunit
MPMIDVPRLRVLRELTRVRFLEFVREPEAVFWTFVFPILLAVGLGIAFRNRPADSVRAAVVTTGAEATDSALARAPGVVVVRVPTVDSARALLRAGDVAIGVVPSAAGIVYHFDDTRPDARTARRIVDDAIQRAAGRADPVPATEEPLRETGSRYIDFVIPGMIGMGIMANSIWGLGFVIVDARRRKLLKRFMATPMRRTEYLASFVAFRMIWLLLEVVVLLGFGALVFDVPVRGPAIVMFAVVVVSALAFGALGLLIAARPQTIEGASGLMNLVMMPMWVLSGVFFSSQNFPAAVQPFIQSLPLTATNDALRAVMLRGAGWNGIGIELAILGAWTVVCAALALRLFRWR